MGIVSGISILCVGTALLALIVGLVWAATTVISEIYGSSDSEETFDPDEQDAVCG